LSRTGYNHCGMSEAALRDLKAGTRVLVAMSGGVDSSMAAYRLTQAGLDVTGITMHLVPVRDRPRSGAQATIERVCCSLEAAESARGVAARIGIPHYMLNLADLFEEKVMGPTRSEYARGRTPNPCVLCNRYMKFDVLFRRAEQLGISYVATGHYARIVRDSTGLHLFKGVDPEKDQSYFLAFLTEKDMGRILFPLGRDTKESVRAEAAGIGLKVADRAESQDLCFFASGFELPETEEAVVVGEPGEIVTSDGRVIGRHQGIGGYTIGQRRGIPGGMPGRMYVVGIDNEANRVVVGPDEELYSSRFTIEDVSLVSEDRDRLRLGDDLKIQVRYRTEPVSGKVELTRDGTGSIVLEREVRAITPGQIAVMYSGDEVLGAGTIRSVESTCGRRKT
jgi:tRNA-specific 2-thiouridylase